MSQSPTKETNSPGETYLDAWQDLATRIRHGNSFSGREPNSAFLNTRGQRFADISLMAGLGWKDDGRGLAWTDWDRDGDLDLWISNRTAPRVRFLRNDYEASPSSAMLRLEGDPARRCPRDAIGAVVTMTLTNGQRLVRHLSAGEGFLSQSSKWLHFGLGETSSIRQVAVRWPGTETEEVFQGVSAGRWHLRQGSGKAVRDKNKSATLPKGSWEEPSTESNAHVILTDPRDAPTLRYRGWDGKERTLNTQSPTLTVLWASWCQPCLRELAALTKARAQLEKAGLQVIALNMEEAQASLTGDAAPDLRAIQKTLSGLRWPFASGRASTSLVEDLDGAQQAILYRQEPLPLPSSFLWHRGQLFSFAKGEISVAALLRETKRVTQTPTAHPDHAVPLPGRWSTQHFITNPIAIANVYLEGGYTVDARQYLEDSLAKLDRVSDPQIKRMQEADIAHMLGETYRLENAPPKTALPHYQRALQLNPTHPAAALSYARALAALKRSKEAIPVLERVLKQFPKRHDIAVQLGNLHQALGQDTKAIAQYRAALEAKPTDFEALNQLCWAYATSAQPSARNPRQAMALAQTIAQRYGNNAHALDTVAAALAAAGQWERATQTAQRALALAQQRRDPRLVRDLQARLKLYQSRKPFTRR